MRATLITAPASEPVSLETVREHLNLVWSGQDSLLEIYLQAARQHVENTTGVRLINQTWRLVLDAFPAGRALRLPGYPLRQVQSITYVDVDGNPQELDLDELVLDTSRRPGAVVSRSAWPATAPEPSAVYIDYEVGFGEAPEDVPADLRNAVLMVTADLFVNRQSQQAEGLKESAVVTSLLWPWRVISP